MSEFYQHVAQDVQYARKKAKRNNAWASSRRMVNQNTGEIVSDKEGNPLSLADMSKSWYSEKGGRNNAFSIVKRLQKAYSFQCDLKKFRPKFITLTFAEIVESWQAERAIQTFLDTLRHWSKRQGIKTLAYFWTSEVQERGALHYHLLVLGAPYLNKNKVASWWSYGFVDIRAVDETSGGRSNISPNTFGNGDILRVILKACPIGGFSFRSSRSGVTVSRNGSLSRHLSVCRDGSKNRCMVIASLKMCKKQVERLAVAGMF